MEPGGHLEIVLLDFADRAFSRDALDIAVRLITMTSHNRALSLLQNKIEMSRVDYNRDENKESLSAPLVQLLPSSSIFHVSSSLQSQDRRKKGYVVVNLCRIHFALADPY